MGKLKHTRTHTVITLLCFLTLPRWLSPLFLHPAFVLLCPVLFSECNVSNVVAVSSSSLPFCLGFYSPIHPNIVISIWLRWNVNDSETTPYLLLICHGPSVWENTCMPFFVFKSVRVCGFVHVSAKKEYVLDHGSGIFILPHIFS